MTTGDVNIKRIPVDELERYMAEGGAFEDAAQAAEFDAVMASGEISRARPLSWFAHTTIVRDDLKAGLERHCADQASTPVFVHHPQFGWLFVQLTTADGSVHRKPVADLVQGTPMAESAEIVKAIAEYHNPSGTF